MAGPSAPEKDTASVVTRSAPTAGRRAPPPRGSGSRTTAAQEHLSSVVRFGISAWSPALDAPQAHQAEKGLGREPMLIALTAERPFEVAHLAGARRTIERHEHVGLAEIAVVLRDFVLQNAMVAKRIPSEVRDDAVILVPII